jgi:ribonuclease P protein component
MCAESDRSGKAAAGFSFPRQLRLRKHADFDRVYQNGRRISQPDLFAVFLRSEVPGVRVGFTVGRVIGNAVERNRLRRRLREAVRHSVPRDRQASGIDLVIQPRKSALQADFGRLQQQIVEVFRGLQSDTGKTSSHHAPRRPRNSPRKGRS